MNKENNNKVVTILILVIISAFVLPWKNISWGKIRFQDETIVVTGESKTKQKNEVASFSAGVNVINIKKEDAVAEVNKKIDELINSVKTFGIATDDIKTQSMSVYQQQEPVYSSSGQPGKNGQWVVNNTIEITLRDVSKVDSLVDLLNKSGANNVYGPNFRIEETADAEKALVDSAMADAKEKAEIIAKSAGRKLGKVVNVSEGSGGISYPMYSLKADGLGGGAAAEPGTSTISKTLTVTFELK